MSAVSSQQDMFVVVDFDNSQVCWVDKRGRVLRKYGGLHGRLWAQDLYRPEHIIEHSKGALLIADYSNNRVVLLSNEARLLQHLLTGHGEVSEPNTLHLDE